MPDTLGVQAVPHAAHRQAARHYFAALPDELVHAVLQVLSSTDVEQARLTCRQLARVGKEPDLAPLQQQLSWHLYGLHAGEFLPFLQRPQVAAALRHAQTLSLGQKTLRTADVRALGRIVSSPRTPALRSLDLSGNRLRGEVAAALDFCAALPRLTSLNLAMNSLTDAALADMVRRHVFANLHDLDLSYNSFALQAASAWRAQSAAPRLQRLCLSSCNLADSAALQLAETPALAALTRLDVAQSQLSAVGVAALAQLGGLVEVACDSWAAHRAGNLAALLRLPQLQRLSSGNNALGEQGAAALLGATGLRGLTSLSVRRNGLCSRSMAKLAAAAALRGLQHLDLEHNPLHERGVRALVQAPCLTALRSLNLCHTHLDDDASQLLLTSPRCARLTSLRLGHNQIGASGIYPLASHAQWQTLRVLDLAGNNLDLTSLGFLLHAAVLRSLQQLYLCHNTFDRGVLPPPRLAAAFDRSPAARGLPALRDLTLEHCALSCDALAMLCDATAGVPLRYVAASGNRLGQAGPRRDAALQNLARGSETLYLLRNGLDAGAARNLYAGTLAQLRTLALGDNFLGDAGAEDIARAHSLSHLEALFLHGNGIHSRGAAALAQTHTLPFLELLDLNQNEVGDAGGAALLSSVTLPRLRYLYLEDNGCGVATGRAMVAHREPLPRLLSLRLGYNALGSEGLLALSQAPRLRRLTDLSITLDAAAAEVSQRLRQLCEAYDVEMTLQS